MHDPKTVEAFATAELKNCSVLKEDFRRYEIQFSDEIPEELKMAAQNTETAREIGAAIITIPDENIISHLKVYDKETATIALNVTFPNKGTLYTLEVALHPNEKHLFDEAIDRANKEDKIKNHREYESRD